jgi:hypothetical protein
MNFIIVIGVIGLLAVAWHVVASMMIYDALKKRGVNVNVIFLRMLIIRYASQYKEITLKETGHIGPLFYHWIISINIALTCVIVLILLRLF